MKRYIKYVLYVIVALLIFFYGLIVGNCYGRNTTLNNAIISNDKEMGYNHFKLELDGKTYYYYYE